MLTIDNLKPGDLIIVNDEGVKREGMVVKLSKEEGQALVHNGIQEFWYSPENMEAIPLNEENLLKFGFEKEEVNGAVKYKRDSFRLVTPQKGDFSNIEMWWREDRRHFSTPLFLHEFQNYFLDMTKMHLERR